MVKTASTNTSPTKTREQSLWDAVDKMRRKFEVGEYRHIIVGPVFPKYVSDTFPASRAWVRAESSFKNCGNQTERW